MMNGSANRIDAPNHFHMNQYNCLTVTCVNAFSVLAGKSGGGIGPVGITGFTGAVFARSSSLDMLMLSFRKIC